ncbi:MAG: hypothetical protein IJI59_03965 [Clostridia bacterium]|nr:hypothetical protein [Clostridia bacterium]
MTFQTYLKINGTALPVQKDDYSVDYSDVVADSGGVTEAGTTIRDVIREGVPSISVTIPVSVAWLKRLRKLKKQPQLNVEWLDPETGELSTGVMYMDGFKVSLEHDTSEGGLWSVSFSLEDLNDV